MIQHNSGLELATIESHASAVASLVEQARAHRVTDDFTRGQAADLRGALKQAEKRVEEARTSLVKPLNDHVKSINARFAPLSENLAAAVRSIDGEIIRDRREREAAAEAERKRLEAERLAAEKKAREEHERQAREAAAKAEAEAISVGMTPADAQEVGALFGQDVAAAPPALVVQAAPPPPPARTIAGVSGVATVKKTWDFEIVDLVALAQTFPEALDVKRKPILDHLRRVEEAGGNVEANAKIAGIRAFKRDLVSG